MGHPSDLSIVSGGGGELCGPPVLRFCQLCSLLTKSFPYCCAGVLGTTILTLSTKQERLIRCRGATGQGFYCMEKVYKDFKLERLGDGQKFVEATCPKCLTRFTIDLDRESIIERLDEHLPVCRAAKKANA